MYAPFSLQEPVAGGRGPGRNSGQDRTEVGHRREQVLVPGGTATIPFGPAERPMGGYAGLPEIWNAEGDGDEARAKAWVKKAFEHVAGLPPKESKARGKKS